MCEGNYLILLTTLVALECTTALRNLLKSYRKDEKGWMVCHTIGFVFFFLMLIQIILEVK